MESMVMCPPSRRAFKLGYVVSTVDEWSPPDLLTKNTQCINEYFQPRYVEGTDQVLSSAVTLRPNLSMGQMMRRSYTFIVNLVEDSEVFYFSVP